MIPLLVVALWVLVEYLHIRRARDAGAAVVLDWREWALGRGVWMLRRLTTGTLVTMYALALCLLVGLYSIPFLQQCLASVFGFVRMLDPTFPLDSSFRLHGSFDLTFGAGGDSPDAALFRRYAVWVFAEIYGVVALLDRWADYVWGEDRPLPLSSRLRRNAGAAGALGLAIFVVSGIGSSLPDMPLWVRVFLSALAAVGLTLVGTAALGLGYLVDVVAQEVRLLLSRRAGPAARLRAE